MSSPDVPQYCAGFLLLRDLLRMMQCSKSAHRVSKDVLKQTTMITMFRQRRTCTDAALSQLAKSCGSLLHINLSFCMSVTVEGVRSLVENCVALSHIDLSF